jgi:hypothetical protein
LRDLTALRVHTGLATPQLLGASAGVAWLKGAAGVLVGIDVDTGFRRHRCIVPAESGLLLAGSTVVLTRGAELVRGMSRSTRSPSIILDRKR